MTKQNQKSSTITVNAVKEQCGNALTPLLHTHIKKSRVHKKGISHFFLFTEKHLMRPSRFLKRASGMMSLAEIFQEISLAFLFREPERHKQEHATATTTAQDIDKRVCEKDVTND